MHQHTYIKKKKTNNSNNNNNNNNNKTAGQKIWLGAFVKN